MKVELLNDIVKCHSLVEQSDGDTKVALSRLLELLKMWYIDLV